MQVTITEFTFERRYEEEAALVVMNLFPTRASRTTSGGSAMVVGFEQDYFRGCFGCDYR